MSIQSPKRYVTTVFKNKSSSDTVQTSRGGSREAP